MKGYNKMKVKNIGKYHQNKIRKQALKDPVGSYFFGGFDLLPTKKQDEVKQYLNEVNQGVKNENTN
jgi:hypothetical protein